MAIKEVLLLITFLSSLDASSVRIKCNFKYEKFEYLDPQLYVCDVESKDVFGDDPIDINVIQGIHKDGKKDKDVDVFRVENASVLTHIPGAISGFFTHLRAIIACQNTQLTLVTSEDLKMLSKLIYLDLSNNAISSIESDVFEHNLDLEVVLLQNNKISHIDPFVFSNLAKLHALDLSNNGVMCKTLNLYKTRADVESAIAKIENLECAVNDLRLHRSLLKHISASREDVEWKMKLLALLVLISICPLVIGLIVVVVVLLRGRLRGGDEQKPQSSHIMPMCMPLRDPVSMQMMRESQLDDDQLYGNIH